MENVKVCHVTSSHDTNDVRIFKKECVSLASHGFDVYLVGPGESRIDNGVNVYGTKYMPEARIGRFLIQPWKVYREARDLKCDIYHLHDPELVPYIPFFKKRGKVIFDSHENILGDDYDREWIWKPIQKVVAILLNAFFKCNLKKVDSVISVSPHIVENLKLVNDSVYMVTNYPENNSAIEFTNADKKYDLCFTGAINDMWNIEKVFDILDDIPNVTFVLCGPASREYIERLKKHESWKRVDYRGVVSHQEAKKIQNISRIGLAIASKYSGTNWGYGTLGNTKLFEYMLAGLPAICTDFALWNYIISKHPCGICVNPDNKNEIKKTILDLLESNDRRKSMSKVGKKAAESEYNWETQAQILFEIYNNILG